MSGIHNHEESHDPAKCPGCIAELKSVIVASRFAFTNDPPSRLFVMPDLGSGSVEFGLLDGVLYKRRLGPWAEVNVSAEIAMAEGFIKSVTESADRNAKLGKSIEEEVDLYARSAIIDRINALRALNYKGIEETYSQDIQISITS